MAVPTLSLAAQQPATSVAPSGRRVVPCAGQQIEQVTIYTEAPSVASLRRVPVVANVARTLHETTQPAVVERFLLFKAGDACEELRRAESERILRAQPFIADADVFIVSNDDGTVDAEVRTIDETAIVLGGSVRARSPNVSGVLFGNANLGGQGVYATGAWRTGDGFRDGFTGRLIDNQFLGQALVAGLEGERNPIGGSWRVQAGRPFFTDLQRIAWRARIGESAGCWSFGARTERGRGWSCGGDSSTSARSVASACRAAWACSALSLTGDDEEPGNRLVAADSGMIRDLGPVPRPYVPHHIARINVLLGVRDIRFVRRRALDAITASQDVPLGVQFGMQAGRSSPTVGAKEEDFFLAGDLYVGLSRSERATTRLQLQTEGRRASGGAAWDGVLSTGRLTHQIKVNPAHLDQLVLEWAGDTSSVRRSSSCSAFPKAGCVATRSRRSRAASVSSRAPSTATRTARCATWATSVWPGSSTRDGNGGRRPLRRDDAGEGLARPQPARVGAAAVGARVAGRSRVPLSGGANASWTLRFTNDDRTAFVFRDARDVSTGREPTVPSSIFAWP